IFVFEWIVSWHGRDKVIAEQGFVRKGVVDRRIADDPDIDLRLAKPGKGLARVADADAYFDGRMSAANCGSYLRRIKWRIRPEAHERRRPSFRIAQQIVDVLRGHEQLLRQLEQSLTDGSQAQRRLASLEERGLMASFESLE